MTEIDDITLVAYADGELDPSVSAEVEAALVRDAALRRKLASLHESASLLRAALNHVTYTPAPEIELKPPPLRSASWGWLPMAASLAALAVGVVLGTNLTGSQSVPGRLSTDDELIQSHFARVLEKELSGTTVNWENPDSGGRGSITPVRTYKSRSGQYCREFEAERIVGDESIAEQGIACREGDGNWRVKVRYYDG